MYISVTRGTGEACLPVDIVASINGRMRSYYSTAGHLNQNFKAPVSVSIKSYYLIPIAKSYVLVVHRV